MRVCVEIENSEGTQVIVLNETVEGIDELDRLRQVLEVALFAEKAFRKYCEIMGKRGNQSE